MSIEANAPAANTQPEFTQTDLDTATASASATARAEGVAAAETSERARFAQLAELDSNSKISASLTTAVAEGTSAGDFAIGLARASKQVGVNALAGAQADADALTELPAGGAAAVAAAAQRGVPNRGAAFKEKKAAANAA